MANESTAGRDGYILAAGHRIYHVYKQNFPMEFIYGLKPEDNRETCADLIDVRTLPEKYRREPIEVRWTDVPKRSMAKRGRDQLTAHALTFAHAITDGYDLAAHIVREHEKEEREWEEYRAKQAEQDKKAADLRAKRDAAETPEAAAMRHIETLRATEGDSVTILCDNPDPIDRDHQCAVVCNGEWTEWQDQRFHGETLLQALARAAFERELYEEIPF